MRLGRERTATIHFLNGNSGRRFAGYFQDRRGAVLVRQMAGNTTTKEFVFLATKSAEKALLVRFVSDFSPYGPYSPHVYNPSHGKS